MTDAKNEMIIKIGKGLDRFYDLNGYSPSVRELSVAMGIPKSTMQRYLDHMKDIGIIRRGRFGMETDHISKIEKATVTVPKIGRIPCGPLTEEEEYIDGYVRLPASFLGKGQFFILTASGTSMIEAGIDDGDLVVIRKTDHAKSGDIVVALANGQNTLKRYFPEPSSKRVRLHPENSEMEDIFVTECIIQGVATKVIKSL